MRNSISVWVRTWILLCLGGLVDGEGLWAQAGWTSGDIGAVAVAGSSAESGGGIVVRGSGADIWDTADEFRFVYRAMSGDGDFVVRLTGMENTNGWAKAGIMFRDGLTTGAANVYLALTPNGVVQFQQRSTAGAGTTVVQAQWSSVRWLKLTRRGNVFAAFTSQSGASWEALGSVTLALSSNLSVGLAVTSHNDGVLCAATFDPVVPPGAPPPATPGVPSNLRGTVVPGAVELTWTDTATTETRFALYRSRAYFITDPPPNDASEFSLINSAIPANSTSYRDSNNGTTSYTYYYALRAVTDGAVPSDPPVLSGFSNLAGVTFPLGWTGADVGAVGATGRSSNDRVIYTVAGAGADIGGTADACHFYGLIATGGVDMRARVMSVANTDPQAKAGIMFRRNFDPGAGVANAYVYVTPAGVAGFQVRRGENDPTTTIGTASVALPILLRLEREGDIFTGYYSSDGNNWTSLGSAYANVPRMIDYGFAVTSHRAGTVCEARFDRVSVLGSGLFCPAVWPTPTTPGNVAATGLAPDEIQLAWTLPRGGERGCEIQRSTDGVNFVSRVSVHNLDVFRFVDRLVTPGTRYYYRLRSYNPDGYSTPSPVVSAVPPSTVTGLADPTYLIAEPWGELVRLSWVDNSSYETGYEIERSADGAAFTRLTTVASSSFSGLPSFTDNSVVGGVNYRYRVRAQAGGQVSGYSNISHVTAPGTDAGPAAPTNLTAAAPSSSRVELGWQDNATNEVAYVIERAAGFSGDFTTLVTLGANVTAFVDTNVSPNTWYSYRVYARNTAGASGYSNYASLQTPAAPPPNGTTWESRDIGLVAVAGSDSESGGVVTISASGADIWDRADEFRFRFVTFTGDGEIVARVTALGNTDAWAKAGVMFRESLQSGSPHAFMCIAASNGTALQRRAMPNEISASTTGTPFSSFPRWVRLVRNGNTFIGYESTDGVAWSLVESVTLNMLETVYVGLAVTSHADGTLTTARFDNVAVRATGGGSLPAPSGLNATAVAYNRVDLRWTDNSSGEAGFEIQMAPNPTAFSAVATTAANATSSAITGLWGDSVYYFRVRAFDAGGSSSFSNVVSVTTPSAPPPPTLGAPTNLVVSATTDTTVDLSWTDNSTSELGFEIGISTDGTSYDWGGRTFANATTGQAAGLRPATLYYFRVRAYQDGGNTYLYSAPSNTASATTRQSSTPTPPPPPNPPSNVTATVISASQINLAWSDASSDETGFEIETSEDNVAYSLIATTAANVTSHTHSGLKGSTTYFYRLRAVNAGGRSAYTTPVQATTPAAPVDTFVSADVGAVAVAGRTEGGGGTIQLTGSGADIWNTADEFRYHYRAFTGDGTIVARVVTLTDTHGWAKAGVMFRESLEANARHAHMVVSIAHGTALQYREVAGGESGSTAPTETGGAPRWLRLVRSGNTFTGAHSTDGVSWTPAGSVTLALPATIYVGLAVTSHNDGMLCTAAFDGVAVSGGASEPPPPSVAAPTGLAAVAGTNGYARLTWIDNATNETGYEVERATGGGSFVLHASIPANATSYPDSSGVPGTTYTYRVRAVAGSVASGYSNTAAFTYTGGPAPTWSFGDIGAVGIAGSNSSSGNTITIAGSGEDIWGGADEFRFVYRTLTGDGSVEAQVTSQQYTHGWAKAGVMIRESLDANARNAFAFVTPVQHGVVAQARAATGGETSSVSGPMANTPYWVRLTRQGATVTAAASPDGVTWTNYATFTLSLGATAYFGFAVTSHDDTQLSTAVFTDPSVH